jgi:hypothetical protein
MLIDVKKLRNSDRQLMQDALDYKVLKDTDEPQEVMSAPRFIFERLRAYSNYAEKPTQPAKSTKQCATAHKMQEDIRKSQEEFAQQVRADIEANRKKQAQQQEAERAFQRLDEYSRDRRLAETHANIDKISGWIQANCSGQWTVANVDAAIVALQNQLEFRLF